MKLRSLLLTFFYFSFSGVSIAQLPPPPFEFSFTCGVYDSLPVIPSGPKNGVSCESMGLALTSVQEHIPYIPEPDDPTLYVNVNLIFIAKDDGTDMFDQSNAEHVQIWEDIESRVNLEFVPLTEPDYINDPDCEDTNANFVSDSKIQFIFNPVYINNSQYYDLDVCTATSVGNVLQPFLSNLLPQEGCNNSINLTIPTDSLNLMDIIDNGADYESCYFPNAILPSFNDLSKVGYVHMPNLYSKYVWMKTVVPSQYNEPWEPVVRNWFVGSVAETLAHELGHCLGLHHMNGVHGSNQCSHSIMNQGGNTPGNFLPPSEVGKMHRALAHSSVRSAVDASSYSPTPIIVSGNEIWDTDRKLFRPVIVSSGATLTVKCKLLFHQEANLVVEAGGQLVVDGGILTSHCKDLWKGIEVWGNTSQHQYASSSGLYYQGRVLFKNDAIVENARCAVRNWQPGNWGARGGIIQAKNSTFRNCKRMIEFVAYQNFSPADPNVLLSDRSYFEQCDFEMDDEYSEVNSTIPFAMITLWGVQNIKIKGCNFSTNTSVNSSIKRSKAIYSIDASYTVDGFCPGVIPVIPCPSLVPSTFVGFNIGVHATGAEKNPTITIKNSNFDKNMVGIKFDNASNGTALFNEFIVGGHPFDPPENIEEDASFHTAIIVNKTNNYIIEENEVSSAHESIYNTHGIVIIDGGDESLELYKNSFHNLTSGSIAIGDNQDVEGAYGLRFICNTNEGNNQDFELRPSALGYSYIDLYQSGLDGYLHAAGNTFSAADGLNSNYVHFDFYSDDNYLYRYDGTTVNQTPLMEEIIVEAGSLTLESGGIPNGCITHFPVGPIDVLAEQQVFLESKDEYYNLVYTYHQYIDKGNTEGTINDIALLWPEDAWMLRNELIQRSPFNSDSVLIAAANRNILPHGMLLEILIANPDALRNGRIIDHVECCIPDPMPSYMIDILKAAKDVRTARTIMEHNRSNLHAQMARSHRKIIFSYSTDTIKVSPDTLIHWYDEMKTRVGKYRLAIEYSDQQNFSDAHSVLDSLEGSLRLSSTQKIEHNSMRQYLDFIESIYNDGRTVAQLDTVEIMLLKVFSNRFGGGIASDRANNILCFFYDICRDNFPKPKSMSSYQEKPELKLETLLSEQNSVLFKPNPADSYIEFEYTLLFEKENTYMNVWDLNGKKIHSWKIGYSGIGQRMLDTRRMQSGIYIVEVTQDGVQVFSDKFIVRH